MNTVRRVVWPDGAIRTLVVDERTTHVVFRPETSTYVVLRPGRQTPPGWWIDSEHRSLAAAERAAGRRNLAAARAHVAEVLTLSDRDNPTEAAQ